MLDPPIRQPYSNEDKQKSAERRFWERQIRVAKWLNGITAAAAVVGVVGLIFIYLTLEATDYSTIEANRAWIAPYSAVPIGKDVADQIVFEISFSNVGKTPALGANWKTESGKKPTPPGLDWSLLKFEPNGTCNNLVPIPEGPVTYPPAPRQPAYIRRTNSGPKVTFDSIKDGKSVVYLRGCVAYKTMGIIGHSAFCWIFDPIIPDASGHVIGHANICESGSFAN